jgi:hypothetical protein
MAKVTRYDLIRQFFIDHKNEWASIDEVAAIGIPIKTVIQVMYVAKWGRFERRHGRGSPSNPQQFRLKA